MVPLKSLITVACTMALVAAGALTGPIVAHSDQVAFGPDASPAEVAARITAGSRSLVVMPDGEICGWGGTLQERGTPAPEPECFWLPGGIAATSISAVTHAVAVGADGVAYTWGSIGSSVAYDPSDESYDVARPVKLPAGAAPVIAVSAGQMYTAVLTEDGAIYTSGHNEYGQLGDGTVVHYSKPWEPGWPSTKVDADGVVFTAVAAGYTHTLALSDEGKVYAWGADESGQLGPNGAFDPDADFDTYGATNPSAWMVSTPVEVPLPGPIVQIAAGYSHSVALSADGHVYTWGWNSYGALGIGKATRFSHVPVKVNIAGV
ncbi:MAG: hypothetical protein LBK59_10185, partial [Bifidobacteriaceae bacterium]|nr:hypothetical protein [Bifidobacteriaceae bacterium]